jgi:hypothetical protein
MEPEPQPCKRFWRMRVTPAFWAHLKNCPKCTAVIRYLELQFEIDRFLWQHRNRTPRQLSFWFISLIIASRCPTVRWRALLSVQSLLRCWLSRRQAVRSGIGAL